MKRIVQKKIEQYCQEHSNPESQLLHELVVETFAHTAFPEMEVGHLEGAFLRMLVRLLRAKRILELGTFTGYSSLLMAEGLPDDGKLITCDINLEATEIAKNTGAGVRTGRRLNSSWVRHLKHSRPLKGSST